MNYLNIVKNKLYKVLSYEEIEDFVSKKEGKHIDISDNEYYYVSGDSMLSLSKKHELGKHRSKFFGEYVYVRVYNPNPDRYCFVSKDGKFSKNYDDYVIMPLEFIQEIKTTFDSEEASSFIGGLL